LGVAEGSFFQIFLTAISKIDLMSIAFDEDFKDVYLSFWHEFDGKSGGLPSFVVADGGSSSTTFRGGVRAACVRAMANIYDGASLVGSLYDVDVRVGHRLRGASLYMRALEFRCLRKALESCSTAVMAMCDGDLYPSLHPVVIRLTDQEVGAYVEYLRALYELYKLAVERKILLVGVTKDSFVNYLGARILTSQISKENKELGRELSRIRSIRNIERRLSSLVGKVEGIEVYLREAKRLSVSSDEEVFDEYAVKPGFTTPLVLAPQPIYLSEEIKAGTRCWASSKIRGRLIEAGPPLSDVAGVLDGLYSLPPVVLSYWRPWHGVGVYRLDVGGWYFGLDVKWGSVEGDFFLPEEALARLEGAVAILNSLSPEPFTVKPLLDVDALVRFEAETYKECYEPLLVEALRKAGLKALPTKRDLRRVVGV
jgi:hypothetical protein